MIMSLKQREIKFKTRIKLSHNSYTYSSSSFFVDVSLATEHNSSLLLTNTKISAKDKKLV